MSQATTASQKEQRTTDKTKSIIELSQKKKTKQYTSLNADFEKQQSTPEELYCIQHPQNLSAP